MIEVILNPVQTKIYVNITTVETLYSTHPRIHVIVEGKTEVKIKRENEEKTIVLTQLEEKTYDELEESQIIEDIVYFEETLERKLLEEARKLRSILEYFDSREASIRI